MKIERAKTRESIPFVRISVILPLIKNRYSTLCNPYSPSECSLRKVLRLKISIPSSVLLSCFPGYTSIRRFSPLSSEIEFFRVYVIFFYPRRLSRTMHSQ